MWLPSHKYASLVTVGWYIAGSYFRTSLNGDSDIFIAFLGFISNIRPGMQRSMQLIAWLFSRFWSELQKFLCCLKFSLSVIHIDSRS